MGSCTLPNDHCTYGWRVRLSSGPALVTAGCVLNVPFKRSIVSRPTHSSSKHFTVANWSFLYSTRSTKYKPSTLNAACLHGYPYLGCRPHAAAANTSVPGLPPFLALILEYKLLRAQPFNLVIFAEESFLSSVPIQLYTLPGILSDQYLTWLPPTSNKFLLKNQLLQHFQITLPILMLF